MFKAVIFDMDGVLIDSEIHWMNFGREYFEKRGAIFNHAVQAQMTGHSILENVMWMKNTFALSESVEQLSESYQNESDVIYEKHAQPVSGIPLLLERLKQAKQNLAIASGSSVRRIDMIAKRFDWHKYFPLIVSAEHVNNVGKPAPDIYLETAKRLQLSPAECVVLEDSVNGLTSAKAAGMSCIAIFDPRWSHGDYSQADLMVKSMYDPRICEFIGIPT